MIKTLGQDNIKTLYIFDVFQIDKKLKKWKNQKAPKGKIPAVKDEFGLYVPVSSIDEYEDPQNWADSEESRNFIDGVRVQANPMWFSNPRRINTLMRSVKSWFADKTAEPVEQVFEKILMSLEETKLYNDRNAEFDRLIKNAEVLGQTDLIKKLKQDKASRSFENVLFAKDKKKFITEKQLLEFGKKCEKGLCLDWIANFARVIPDDVLAAKVACDEDELFDNYVILHYDPDNKATTPESRKKEEEKRKDPILFGVIKDSRNLYFVADWKDELCNLTLKDIADKLGKSLEIT